MKRKVIKQANQAYTITLPIEWVRQNNIEKNREIDIEIVEKELIISNKGRIQHKKAEANIENLDTRSIYRIINALYAKGVDEISITSDHQPHQIIKCLGNTMGYALISQENNIFTIKDISGTNYEDLDEIFKRTFQIILNFYELAIDDVFTKQEESTEGLMARDAEINKFCLYLQRAINKMSYPKAIDGRILFAYSFELEKIGDEIQRFWRTNVKHNIQKTKEIKKLALSSQEVLEKAFESYYQFSPKKQEDIYKIRNKLREDSLKIKSNPQTIRAIRHIVKIAEDATDLSHLTLIKKLE